MADLVEEGARGILEEVDDAGAFDTCCAAVKRSQSVPNSSTSTITPKGLRPFSSLAIVTTTRSDAWNLGSRTTWKDCAHFIESGWCERAIKRCPNIEVMLIGDTEACALKSNPPSSYNITLR